MRFLSLLLTYFVTQAASADVMPFDYQLGRIAVRESESRIVIQTTPPLTIDILPGGKSWPILSLDEAGRIYAGNTVIDAVLGTREARPRAVLALPYGIDVAFAGNAFRFEHAGKSCDMSLAQLGLDPQRAPLVALQNRNISFNSSKTTLLALVTRFNEDGDVAAYITENIDVRKCRVTSRQNIGNPDLLIELAHSANGGWWLTGSIEQTLLQSGDGSHWRKVPLPPTLSALVSAYVVSKDEIWLAGIMSAATESPYLLVYSNDGGHTWRNILGNDPALRRIPGGWLEGQKRRAQKW
jgi:hypothetical protein